MTAGWVAPATRGRLLLRRLVGIDGARELAATGSWDEARAILTRTIYGTDLAETASRPDARRRALGSTAWQLRVLAGWLPAGRTVLARLFAAPLEIANIDQRIAQLGGADPAEPIHLGSLVGAWPRVAVAATAEDVRRVLAKSVWGDPGGSEPEAIALALQVALARRFAAQVPGTGDWARGAVAVLVARERFAFERDLNQTTARVVDRLIGSRWRGVERVDELADRLPKSASWALSAIDEPSDLWRAELAVVRRIANDAQRRAMSSRFDESTVTAMMALLLTDLWSVCAAIEVAGRQPSPGEVFDAVA